MSLPLLLPSLSILIRESGPSTLDSEKSLDGSPGLQILQKIASSLSENGYQIIRLKRRRASTAILRCGKGDLRVAMLISTVARKGGVFHCELDLWPVHSIFDGQGARRRRIQRDVDRLRELYCVIDRQVRAISEIDAIRWAVGVKDLPIIGNDGRPEVAVTSNERRVTRPFPISARAE